MKKSVHRLLPVLVVGMLVYAGCAKQEVVKKDQSLVAPAAKPAASAPLKQGATEKPIGTPNVAVSSVQEQKSQQPGTTAASENLRTLLENVYFDFDSSTLSDAARQSLARGFEVLKKYPKSRVRVEGHCDERGSDEYNLALGERRAQMAVRYLRTLGIPADRLTTISYGKEKPTDPGHDEAAWAKNRRDEFSLSN